jgi:hypothetical protein
VDVGVHVTVVVVCLFRDNDPVAVTAVPVSDPSALTVKVVVATGVTPCVVVTARSEGPNEVPEPESDDGVKEELVPAGSPVTDRLTVQLPELFVPVTAKWTVSPGAADTGLCAATVTDARVHAEAT